ncbi:putative pyridoxal phosphate-dependent transferase [Heracleum sosnowskyi]|uniref:Pyridoxal phosphate-dependent transferase n=1 Tax=Heracleum sosnowskyi TaxID=360622 RepID=A0AAD8NDL3_9APIA|nr:putative pyridoxal phosphate-dependent transferase [Heracleum sosnowskyi]
MPQTFHFLTKSYPPTCGGGTVKFVNCFSEKDTLYIEDIEEREDAGTPPIIQKIRAASVFWIKEYIGYKAISTQEHNYTTRAFESLLLNPNICVLGNTSKSRKAIISFLVETTTQRPSNDLVNPKNSIQENETGNKHIKPLHGRFVAKLLNDLFGIQARGGCACAAPYGYKLLDLNEPTSSAIRSSIQKGNGGAARPGWTRVSFPYYMSNEEFEFILEALEFTATYGHRFLPIYNFNWKTGAWTLKKEASMHKLPIKGECEPVLTKEQIIAMTKDVEITSKYASYLDTTKQIACLLPKSPSQRPVPDDIAADFLTFRV